MPTKHSFRTLFAAVAFTIALQGCGSIPGVGSSGASDAGGGAIAGWVEDLIADLGFGSMVSSRIGDAPPVATWLAGISDEMSPKMGTSFDLEPGYYRFRVQSFCLAPGAYGPETHEGQLVAPIRGQRRRLVKAILARAADHPGIPQQDIQRFLWAVDAGLTLPELPPDLRARIDPLLTPQEELQLTVDSAEISGVLANYLLPPEAQQMVARFQDVRALLTDINATYRALERAAVPKGKAPIGPGSRKVPVGQWTYAGDGFYARTIPEKYATTVLEVFRPAPYRIERDRLGRVVRFESGGYGIEASYHEAPEGNIVVGSDDEEGRIWRFKQLRLTGPRAGQTRVVRNRGWSVAPALAASTRPPVKTAAAPGAGAWRSLHTNAVGNRGFGARLTLADSSQRWGTRPELVDGTKRGSQLNEMISDVEQYRRELDRAGRPLDERAVRDLTDLEFFRKGVDTAVNPGDMKGKFSWIRDVVGRDGSAWRYTNCVLAGDCPPPGMEKNPFRNRFDPTSVVSVPGNTSRQPLGLTARIVKR